MLIKKISRQHINSLYKIGWSEFKKEPWFSKSFIKEAFRGRGCFYGAFEKRDLIGGILAKKFAPPQIWIVLLVVNKDFQRKGIGSQLIKAIEKRCSKSFFLIFTDINDHDLTARRFYTKNGFKKQARIKDWFGINRPGAIYLKRVI